MIKFKGIPSAKFIRQRDEKVSNDDRDNPYFFWDSEFPEWHQCEIDPKQNMYDDWHYDTVHEDLGNIDYKLYSKAGIHVSRYIQDIIKQGYIDHLGIWTWDKGHRLLEEGVEAEYTLIGYVPAKLALDKIDRRSNRFQFDIADCVDYD